MVRSVHLKNSNSSILLSFPNSLGNDISLGVSKVKLFMFWSCPISGGRETALVSFRCNLSSPFIVDKALKDLARSALETELEFQTKLFILERFPISFGKHWISLSSISRFVSLDNFPIALGSLTNLLDEISKTCKCSRLPNVSGSSVIKLLLSEREVRFLYFSRKTGNLDNIISVE